MCGFDPFWIYDAMLDEEYRERTGYGLEGTYRCGAYDSDLRIQERDSRSENVQKTN